MKVCENDYYVACNEELTNTQSKKNARYEAVLKNCADGDIKILSVADFFEIVELTADVLEKLKMPTVKKQKSAKRRMYSTVTISNTIGEQLRAKGIDITKFFTE